MERVMGIEPTPSLEAEVLPLNYTREPKLEGEGFEPSKAEPSDLQSDPLTAREPLHEFYSRRFK